MAPLVFRPANTSENNVYNTDTSTTSDISKPICQTSSGKMDTASISDLDLSTSIRKQRSERTERIMTKNRRKRYLDLHPEYFLDSSLELADPLLYDRLIRSFQSAAEREAEGQRKGFAGRMATDLFRYEAKATALNAPDAKSLFTYNRGAQGQIIAEEKDEIPMTKEEGRQWWIDEMTQRFLRGEDEDFEYGKIGEKYNDPEEEREVQEAWFESMESDFDSEGEGREKVLMAETGIQDY